MKINKKDDKTFPYSVQISDFEEHPEMYEANKEGKPIVERMEIAYSKSTDRYYLSSYFANPLDSYGAWWDITDSGCFSLTEEEVDSLIEELQKAKKYRKDNL